MMGTVDTQFNCDEGYLAVITRMCSHAPDGHRVGDLNG